MTCTVPCKSFTRMPPLYVQTWLKYLFFWKSLTTENNFARMYVRSSLIYIYWMGCLSWFSLWAFRCLRLDMTLKRSCFDRNRTMTGLGSLFLAFLGRFKRWLTSMSVAWRGGSSFSTSLASCTIVPVVSSAWSGSSWETRDETRPAQGDQRCAGYFGARIVRVHHGPLVVSGPRLWGKQSVHLDHWAEPSATAPLLEGMWCHQASPGSLIGWSVWKRHESPFSGSRNMPIMKEIASCALCQPRNVDTWSEKRLFDTL